MRGSSAPRTAPNSGPTVMVESGFWKFGRLKILKNSARKSRRCVSLKGPLLIGNDLTKAKSIFAKPGPPRKLRGEFPNVPVALYVNAAVLNHPFSFCNSDRPLGKLVDWPVRSPLSRLTSAPMSALSTPEYMEYGKPVRTDRIPFNLQFPKT